MADLKFMVAHSIYEAWLRWPDASLDDVIEEYRSKDSITVGHETGHEQPGWWTRTEVHFDDEEWVAVVDRARKLQDEFLGTLKGQSGE